MPTKKQTAAELTAAERRASRFKVDGKTFRWTSEDGDEVVLPLRIKLKVIRQFGAVGDRIDADAMFKILEALAPGQVPAIEELDVNDFQAMFEAWQDVYSSLSGASLGE